MKRFVGRMGEHPVVGWVDWSVINVRAVLFVSMFRFSPFDCSIG